MKKSNIVLQVRDYECCTRKLWQKYENTSNIVNQKCFPFDQRVES